MCIGLSLQSIVARNVDPLDSAVITIGKIASGTVQNIIAENARLEGTIRTLSAESMERVRKRVSEIVKGIEIGFQCETKIDFGSMYHQVYNHSEVTKEFMEFVENHTDVNVIVCEEKMTGEDFGFMLKEIPGFMFWLGVDSDYGLHHSKLTPNEAAIDIAIKMMAQYIEFKGNES